jgi:hypothetical protein
VRDRNLDGAIQTAAVGVREPVRARVRDRALARGERQRAEVLRALEEALRVAPRLRRDDVPARTHLADGLGEVQLGRSGTRGEDDTDEHE